ncbi:MAG: DUF2339 domain-containing protein [Saprospiraceae bacterium]
MNEDHQKIDELYTRLKTLSQQQEHFRREIDTIKHELNKLKAKTAYRSAALDSSSLISHEPQPIPVPIVEAKTAYEEAIPLADIPSQKQRGGLEKYIGENLFSKLGIAIIVIGVGIGAKFAIDNELISPLMRVVFGYLVGLGLLGFAVKLKADYHRYSAVLMSGAMAIFYFMTYVSHSFYGFMPAVLAFSLMVAITGMTVMAAIYYKEQVIALIGQVGAYSIPFLLSDGSDNMQLFFTYVAIINVGILLVAFKQYWKTLYGMTFLLTWLFFSAWCLFGFEAKREFWMAFSFNTIYFLLFYITFLAYKLVREEQYVLSDVFLVLVNSFVFFGLGYFLWEGHPSGGKYLGAFALLNGLLHLGVGVLIYLNQKADRNILILVSGLVVLFFTLAVPIQLDGNWVTLVWMGEALLLFSLGRIRKAPIYEKLAYPMLLLAFFSLMEDWNSAYTFSLYGEGASFSPLLNIGFYTSFLCAVGYGLVQWVNTQKKYPFPFQDSSIWALASKFMIPTLLLLVAYNTFGFEISQFWGHKIRLLRNREEANLQISDLYQFALVWRLVYSLAFLGLLSLINYNWIKSKVLGYVNLILNVVGVLAFLTTGLYALGNLWDTYYQATVYPKGMIYVWIRYFAFLPLGLVVYASYKYVNSSFLDVKLKIPFDIAFHSITLWVLSSEWLNWGTTFQMGQSYKLGLSILWGSYSLLLIILGIWKKKVHLRVGAILLFGMTLIKLFFYDMANLGTLPKTIVFIALGILLLVISFLYNKYRQVLFGEEA